MPPRLSPIPAIIILLVAALACGRAQAMIPYSTAATVCPAGAGDTPPSFDDPACAQTKLVALDPQRRDIWVRLVFDAGPDAAPRNAPAGLIIAAKASSAAWLNGVYLGANGAPGPDRATEIPGRMDTVFYAPHEAILNGRNELILRMSSHRGFLRLQNPVHYVSLGRYADPARDILRAYWPSLITFGAFLLGAIYFGVAALRRTAIVDSTTLFALSLLAIAQLALETSRGLFPYLYPFHDLRLVLITLCSALFGFALLFHTATKFLTRARMPVLLAGAALTALATFLPGGFDAKAVTGLAAPALVSAAIAFLAVNRRQPAARAYAVALSLFIAAMLLFLERFLDAGVFYCFAALLLFLIAQQATAFARERALRLDAGDRARRLELALVQARQQDAPERLTIQSAGKTEIVAASDIVYCKGAGDYVEIALADGAKRLHFAKLHELEAGLPQTFLRVHRSYIVNTKYIRALTRESNGVGSLALANGDTVPVSRRILPNVRSALQ